MAQFSPELPETRVRAAQRYSTMAAHWNHLVSFENDGTSPQRF